MLVVLLLTILLLGICFLALGVKIFFHKSHQFPETSAGHSPSLRKYGITCPHAEANKSCGQTQEGCGGC